MDPRPATTPTPTASPLQLLTFEVGPVLLALSIGAVHAIERLSETSAESGRTDLLMHGERLPIVDLRSPLGLSPRSTTSSDARVIVMRFRDRTFGIIADRVRDVVWTDAAATSAALHAPAVLTPGWLFGSLIHDEHEVLVLNADRLLPTPAAARAA